MDLLGKIIWFIIMTPMHYFSPVSYRDDETGKVMQYRISKRLGTWERE